MARKIEIDEPVKLLCVGGPLAGKRMAQTENCRTFRALEGDHLVEYQLIKLVDRRMNSIPIEIDLWFCDNSGESLIEHLVESYEKNQNQKFDLIKVIGEERYLKIFAENQD